MNFLNFLLENPAPQPDPNASNNSIWGTIMSFLPFLLLIPVFYFFMYRPQKKQEKETNEMRNSLMIGDEISTIGGIMGKIVKVKDDYIIIETGADRTKLKMKKTAIASVDKKVDGAEEKKPSSFKVAPAKPKEEKKPEEKAE